MFELNILAFITTSFVWLVIILFAVKLHRQSSETLVAWKVILIVLVGIFSFSFTLTLFDVTFRLSVLPLGVWIVYAFLNGRNRWQAYRKFAWLGFLANFLFLGATLLALLLHSFIYPKDALSTYIDESSQSALIAIHPSAKDHLKLKESDWSSLQATLSPNFPAISWYQDAQLSESGAVQERFPYLLTQSKPMWGSGLDPVIYLQHNGKGALITLSSKQLYFTWEKSIFEVNEHD